MILGVPWWVGALALAVIILGAGRLTRLVVHDDFPPVVRIRIWVDGHLPEEWAKLVHCHWCFSFWATALAVLTFLLSFQSIEIAWAWWLLWGTLALSYLVAQYVHFDEGRD